MPRRAEQRWKYIGVILILVALPTGLRGQTAIRSTRLAVAGRTGEAAVVQAGGRSYVDVEALARITGATLAFQGTQVILTLPNAAPQTAPAAVAAPAAAAPAASRGSSTLSREFVTSAVQAVSAMRDWRVALQSAVQRNQPVSDDLTSPLRRSCETQVSLAAASARTDADHSTTPLLQSQLANLRVLSSNYVGVHDSITNIRTDAVDNDPLNTKVQACMQALASLQAGAAFQDVTACH